MIEKEEKIAYLKEVVDIFDGYDIWYSLDNETLRGAYKINDLLPYDEKLSLMITTEGYQKLLRIFPKRMLDSSLDSSYKFLSPCFVRDNSKWKVEQPFVELRVAIKSTEELINKYESLANRTLNKIKDRPINTRTSINDLETKKFEGYYLLSDTYVEKEKRWIQALSMDRVEIPFSTIKVKVMKEYERVIKKWWSYTDLAEDDKAPRKNYYVYPFPGKRAKTEL